VIEALRRVHSGCPGPAPWAIITMTQLQPDSRLATGIELFNQRNFFEAHEIWEQEWKVAEGVERIFYQGMIQVAVALCHVQRGNYLGAISVYSKSQPKLAQFPALWMGIELGGFRSELAQYFDSLRSDDNTSCRARKGKRRIIDAKQPPAIRLARKG
jgi:hypothetical protein